MSGVTIDFEHANFVFETVMRIRNTEVGIGQHLTMEALVTLLSETRSRFLYSKGIKEINADYQGFIITNVATHMLSRARAREELLFEVGVDNLHETGGDFVFKISRMFDSSAVAYAVMGFVAYDYRLNKTIPLNSTLREVLDSKPFEI